MALAKVLAENGAAVAFAGENKDFLEADTFLQYVVEAKDKDEAERRKAATQQLQSSVAQVETQLQPSSPPPAEQPPVPSSPPAETEPEPSDPDRYYNTADGYSIVLPEGWTQTEATWGEEQAIFATSPLEGSDDVFSENLLVAAEDLPIELSSGEYLDLSLTLMEKTLTDFTQVSRESVTLDGNPAEKIVYTYRAGDYTLKQMMYVVVDGLKAYDIVGSALAEGYEAYAPTFATSAGTFRFE